MSEISGNMNNKDRLFRFIFAREENKNWTLSLYNAINGSDHKNPEDIQINTIDDVMFLGMKNDVSFIISETMNIYEQQSSFNPNMPLRQMMYAGKLYGKYVSQNNLNIYGTSMKKIPVPKLICFYNGESSRPEREIIRLSDAFDGDAEPDIDVRVTMININYGMNKDLMEACLVLKEYSWVVEEIRNNRKSMELSDAIEKAIRGLGKNALLKPFLIGHLAEVKDMCLREYTENEIKEMFKEEGRREGLEEGRIESIRKMVEKLGMTTEEAMDVLEVPETEREALKKVI